MRFKILIFLILLGLTSIALAYEQEEEETPQSEEEIWGTPRKGKESGKKRVEEEEEEIPPGAFEYADEKDKKERKEKREEEREKKVHERREEEKREQKIVGGSLQPDAGPQDTGITAKEKEEKGKVETGTVEMTHLVIPQKRMKDIQGLWAERLNNIKKREFSQAEERLKQIIEIKLDSGIPDIPQISLSLILESKNALRANDNVSALRLSDAALVLSPDIYEVWFYNAYIYWTTNKTDLFKPLQFTLGGLKRAFLSIDTAPLIWGNVITLISLIIAASGLLYILSLLLKNANNILHNLSHLFPSGRSQFISDLIWISIFLILILKFLSVFHFIFISSILMWLYLKRSERVTLVIVIIFISILPYNFSLYNRFLDTYRGESLYSYRALKFEDETAINRLRSRIESGNGDDKEYLTLCLIMKRRGELEIAEKLYKRSIELNASNMAAYNNLGNLYLIMERYEDALAQYNNALNIEPRSEIVRYNISRLFLRKKELDKSNSELSEAKRFNEEVVSELLKNSSSSINRFIADIEPSFEIDIIEMLKGGGRYSSGPYLPLEHYITGGLIISDIPFWLIIMAIAIIFVNLLSRYIFISRSCNRCGKPVCKYCSPEITSDEECSQCFHIFTKRDVSDPKNRIAKDREISNFQFLHNLTIRLLSLVIPGTSYLWSGKTLKGVVVLLFSISGFIAFFLFNRPNPLPYFSTTGFETFFKSPFVIAGIIAYLFSIRDSFRRG